MFNNNMILYIARFQINSVVRLLVLGAFLGSHSCPCQHRTENNLSDYNQQPSEKVTKHKLFKVIYTYYIGVSQGKHINLFCYIHSSTN